jgi:16S rRNA (guanine966-N2)-methyltransferase
VIRIVAGHLASRRLATPPGQGTRPTSQRVRESVFAQLAAWAGSGAAAAERQLAGLSFLDLFAGSGAVGLEAASRGAGPIAWVERDRAAAQLIERNRRQLGVAGTVLTTEVGRLLAAPARRSYDLVWLDPPYDLESELVDRLLDDLQSQAWLAPGGLAMVERSARRPEPIWGPDFTQRWVRHYGDTVVCFARKGVPGS